MTQAHHSFHAAYSRKNSLNSDSEQETTVTSTLYLGARLWSGVEVYVNPELSGGSGLRHAFEIAGFPNGEAFAVGSPEPRISQNPTYNRDRGPAHIFTLRLHTEF